MAQRQMTVASGANPVDPDRCRGWFAARSEGFPKVAVVHICTYFDPNLALGRSEGYIGRESDSALRAAKNALCSGYHGPRTSHRLPHEIGLRGPYGKPSPGGSPTQFRSGPCVR